MSLNKSHIDPCPLKIAIIGGGRWARVLTKTICTIVPETTLITIYSIHNTDTMLTWVMDNSFKQNDSVNNDISRLDINNTDAAIVVHAARAHGMIV